MSAASDYTEMFEKRWKSTDVPENDVIIVERNDGKRDQITVRDGIAYEWRYKDTDKEFCRVDQIKRWRGCTGFDF